MTTAQVAAAVNVSVDGDPKEWTGVEMQSSTDSAVAKWAVMQDEDYVSLYDDFLAIPQPVRNAIIITPTMI